MEAEQTFCVCQACFQDSPSSFRCLYPLRVQSQSCLLLASNENFGKKKCFAILVHHWSSDSTSFLSGNSCCKPQRYCEHIVILGFPHVNHIEYNYP